MKRKEYIKSKKYYLKGLAQQIRSLKDELKQFYKDKKELGFEEFRKKHEGRWNYDIERDIRKAKYEFRHQHIAYCLIRGRSYEQVESKVRENNEPNQDYIKQLLEEYPSIPEMEDEAAICPNS